VHLVPAAGLALDEAMLTMRPHPASIMSPTTAWQQSKDPRTLMAKIWSNSSRVMSWNFLNGEMAALFTRIVAAPCDSRTSGSPFSGGFLGVSSAGDDDFGASEQSAAVAVPFAPAPFQENFGMTAIREIISAAKNLNGNGPTPARLVEALAIAKEKGLDDVARELEAQLGIPKKPVEIHKIEDKKPEPQKEAS